jgi:2-oxoglutarate dehydrogenase E2 component (dihydrolipoamide succinyltransferase)
MAISTIRMPQLGESVVEGTVGKWLVREGERVEKDQAVVEILTDKADSEVPAPAAGVVTRLLVGEGAVVAVGDALCEVDPSGTATATSSAAARVSEPPPPPERPVQPLPTSAGSTRSPTSASSAGTQRAPSSAGAVASPAGNGRGSAPPPSSPSVRKLAREQGIDLQQLAGSGEGGRVTHDDVLRAAAPPPPAPTPTANALPSPEPRKTSAGQATAPVTPAPSGAFRVPPYIPRQGDQVIPMSRRRRIIADHMVYSKLTAPHVVTFAECDLHKTDKMRRENKDRLAKEGVGLTMLSFVAAATARALREFRSMNARVLDDSYVILGEVNLGIAVDTPDGLIVPVVRHADELTVRGLARAVDEVAKKARDNTLTPDDLAGKTFTISNPGKKGNLVGGAIISQPNVGILRTGEIKKRVVVIEHDGEDVMAIHPVMHMALSYDHRIVDGVAANGFLHRVVEILEAADFSL